jgi:hypothetical protein
LLNEINKAVANGMPLLAIVTTLALPDICIALASADGRSGKRDEYEKWCRDNLGPEFSFLTPEDLWSMRSGVLHQGRFGGLKHNVARIIFALPGGGFTMNNKINDAYFCGVKDFCGLFTSAVYQWMEKNKSDPTVQANLPRLMQYHVGGLPPYVSGITVLA